ncbi:MAG: hypothetical protein MJZ67_00655 [Bacteroidales bacterium]|nr:hypothetical protein [Bacteroidales bacterium]
MNIENKKTNYCAPQVKVVAFQIEKGFAGSDLNRLLEIPSNTQVESWRYNGDNTSDNISNHFGNLGWR